MRQNTCSTSVLIAMMAGCAKPVSLPLPAPLAPDRAGVTEPARVPPLDDRDYRIVRLHNGLTAMLVSDPNATESAAALALKVGSLSEPDDRAGLAHFLEHMLFLGTDTYPDAEGYGDHLATHGGSSNAWTGDEVTQYYFVVDPGGFDEALHRFSRFFIDPQLDARYVDKERHAVESEYRLKIESRWHRWYAAVGETVHPDHPGQRFSVGTLDTLADHEDDLVVDDLREFYATFYTAERMHLAVLSADPLDTLEGQVRAWFAEVPAGAPLTAPDWPPQFREDQLGVRIDVDQMEDVHSLLLEWPIAEQADAWPDDPVALVSHVLGDEGPGSLFAQLAERNWVTSLSSGAGGSIGPDGDVFQLDMTLTADGAAHTDDIVAACFAAIETLREQGAPAYLATETIALDELSFRYGQPSDAGPLTEWLAETMTEHPAERALDAWLTRPVDDPAVIAGIVDQLSIDRVRIIEDGQGLAGEPTGRESFYDVAYRIRPLEDTEREHYTAGSDLVIALPPVNPWLPRSTTLRTDQNGSQSVIVEDTGPVETWLTPAARWHTPKAITQLDLRLSEEGFDTAEDKVLGWLYEGLLDQYLIDFAYPVELAGSEFWLSIRPARFRLHVEGWSDVHAALVDAVLNEVAAFEPEVAAFEAKKTDYLRAWRNRVHAAPVELVSDVPYQAVDPEDADYQEWIAILEDTSFEELQRFADTYWRPGSLRAQVYGDVDEVLARKVAGDAARHLLHEAPGQRHDYQQVRWLPAGVERTHEVAVDHDDSALFMLYMGPPGPDQHALWGLLGHLLGTPFFQELRTEQQLGYVASAWGFDEHRVPGLHLQLQSSVVGPTVLLERTDAFLSDWPKTLRKMDAMEFETARQAYAEQWREPPSTFHERWGEVSRAVAWGDGAQPYAHAVANAVETVDQDDIVALAESLFVADSPTRIVAWAVGNAHADDPLKDAADCDDRACVAEGMQVVFTMDFAHPDPAGVSQQRLDPR